MIMPRTTEADRIATFMDLRDMLLAQLLEGKTLEDVIATFDRVIARRARRLKDQQQ